MVFWNLVTPLQEKEEQRGKVLESIRRLRGNLQEDEVTLHEGMAPHVATVAW